MSAKTRAMFFGSIGATPQGRTVYQHAAAMAHHMARGTPLGKSQFEQALVLFTQALAIYADAHSSQYEQPLGEDPIMGAAWCEIAEHVIVLLGGERGRLDAGTIDALLRKMAEANGMFLAE